MWGSNFPATNDRSLKEQYDPARNELSFCSGGGPDSSARRLSVCGQCCGKGLARRKSRPSRNFQTTALSDGFENFSTSNRNALSSTHPTRAHQGAGERNNQLSSGCSNIGTASSNSFRSAEQPISSSALCRICRDFPKWQGGITVFRTTSRLRTAWCRCES
jgi:hypothetical protein